jgi:hypothetical protein
MPPPRSAFPKATGTNDKDPFLIEGAQHIESGVDAAVGKLTGLCARTLG